MFSPRCLLLCLSCVFALTAVSAGLPPWQLSADGLCVKVRVCRTGMYAVSYGQLRAMGFGSPENVAVFGYGAEAPDVDDADMRVGRGVPRQVSLHHGNRLIFFGEGPLRVNPSTVEPGTAPEVVRNPYSLYGYYFLAECGEDADYVPLALSDTTGTRLDTHLKVEIFDRDEVPYESSGTLWFETPMQAGGGGSKYVFAPVESDAEPDAAVHFRWLTDASCSLYATMVGATVVGSEGLDAESIKSPRLVTAKLDCRLLEGESPELTINREGSSSSGFTAVDYVVLSHRCPNRLGPQSQMIMYVAPEEEGDFLYCPDAVEIWDVTSATDVRRHEVADGKASPGSRGRILRYVAFNPDGRLPEPEVVGSVSCGDGTLVEGLDGVDMLIVSHEAYESEAHVLADLHRGREGMNVKVVTCGQIYDEFSSGAPSGWAIRAYARLVHGLSGEKLKYLLLYGGGSYDNRGIAVRGDFLPTYQCPLERYMFDARRSYCSDAYFGMLDPVVDAGRMFFGTADLCVGRIPVRTVAEARAVNDKIFRYLTQGYPLASTAVFLCDAGDRGVHLDNAEALAAQFASRQGSVVHKVYSDLSRWSGGKALWAREELRGYLRSGCGYVHYVGHGSEYNITGQDLWSNSAVSVTDYDVSPIVFHSSCLNGRFDGDRRSLAEEMLAHGHGGAVACIMASRSTDTSFNQRLHMEFLGQTADDAPVTTLGEAWRNAQNICVESARRVNNSAYAVNVRNFNLFGDPALPLHRPGYRAVGVSIGGHAPLDDGFVAVTGRVVDICGAVVDGSGGRATDFSGHVNVRAYRTGVVRPTLRQDGSTESAEVVFDDIPVWEGAARIDAGAFAVTLRLPLEADGWTCRLVCDTSDGQSFAVGSLGGFTVVDEAGVTDCYVADSLPPDVSRFGLRGDVISGVTVSPDAVVADISDFGSGLCLTDYKPGVGCRLSIDGRSVGGIASYLSVVSDGEWHLEYPLGRLDDGRHELALSVVDNAGNRTEKSVTVSVLNRTSSVSLYAERRDVRTTARFSWINDLGGEDATVDLIVRDLNGATVCHEKFDGMTGVFEWNLRGLDGHRVADGPYDCMLLATDGRSYTASESVRIIVFR